VNAGGKQSVISQKIALFKNIIVSHIFPSERDASRTPKLEVVSDGLS
jgi:hypothetical protein